MSTVLGFAKGYAPRFANIGYKKAAFEAETLGW
jgi:hypothetical protein